MLEFSKKCHYFIIGRRETRGLHFCNPFFIKIHIFCSIFASRGRLGSLLGRLGGLLEAVWEVLEASWASFGRSWGALGGSWEPSGDFLAKSTKKRSKNHQGALGTQHGANID